MRQLPLDVRLEDHAVFAAFHPGANAFALRAVRDIAETRASGAVWLWGERGTGRSHLLQACVAHGARAGHRSAYFPTVRMQSLGPEVLAGLAGVRLLAVDEVDRVAGDAEWERSLFAVWEALVPAGGSLVFSATRPPADAGFALADLRSRFGASTIVRLAPLTDEDALGALRLRAGLRGLEIPDEAARYLLARVDRSLPGLLAWLDRLDAAALAEQRALTIPFIRKIIGAAAETPAPHDA